MEVQEWCHYLRPPNQSRCRKQLQHLPHMAIGGLQERRHRYEPSQAKVWNQGRLFLLWPQTMQEWLESSFRWSLEQQASQDQGQDGLQISREQVPAEQESFIILPQRHHVQVTCLRYWSKEVDCAGQPESSVGPLEW